MSAGRKPPSQARAASRQRTRSPQVTSKTKKSKGDAERENKRPDPRFKELMALAAREAGLENGPTELPVPQSSSSDMLLTIPPGTRLENTIFYFFRLFDVLEFKGWNDPLDKENFFKTQLARIYLWSAQNKLEITDVLNVIVSARRPEKVLEYSAELGCPFVQTPGREWLWQAQCGWQDVAIVVCSELPIEPRYAVWLLFAPPTSDT